MDGGGTEGCVKAQRTYCINELALAVREKVRERLVRKGESGKREMRRIEKGLRQIQM